MKKIKFVLLAALLVVSMPLLAEKHNNQSTEVKHPEWSKSSVIYELNTRQFTPEGTFKAAQAQLPRLKKLGVDIVWFMPISKIGVVDRKGELGSYYSIQDYTSINPEYGNLEDFKAFVAEAHKLGLKVIIDWVANHTSRDSKWLSEHPDWFVRDANGIPVGPFDWTDVAKLDYSKKEMRAEMVKSMKYWLETANIDGFRCDVAGEVPTDFWNDARAALNQIKPVFMLAEAEKPKLMVKAFDMDYAWELHSIMNKIAQGKTAANVLDTYYKKEDSLFCKGIYRMVFTSNHDENSWNGTEFERMGKAVKTFAAFTYITPSMPLIYNGQEAGFNRRLEFFKKDPITWSVDPSFTPFYQKLNTLKKTNQALWNGNFGGNFSYAIKGNVLTITRSKGKNTVVGIFNLGAESAKTTLTSVAGKDFFSAKVYRPNQELTLNPWEFLIFTK